MRLAPVCKLLAQATCWQQDSPRALLTGLSACSAGKGLTEADVRALLERHVSLDDVDLAKLAKHSSFPRQVPAPLGFLWYATMAL